MPWFVNSLYSVWTSDERLFLFFDILLFMLKNMLLFHCAHSNCRPLAGKGLDLQVFEMDVEDVVDSGNQVENFIG